jgi:hypothetical protein
MDIIDMIKIKNLYIKKLKNGKLRIIILFYINNLKNNKYNKNNIIKYEAVIKNENIEENELSYIEYMIRNIEADNAYIFYQFSSSSLKFENYKKMKTYEFIKK